MSYKLVLKDAVWQILGRFASALGGFIVLKIITPYLGPLRYGDYSTVLKYFVIRTALADLGLYVIAVKKLGEKKNLGADKKDLEIDYGKFVGTRIFLMIIVYLTAILVSHFIPAYTQNQFIYRGLYFGMIYSALFMFAGIIQLPLQIFWKMEKVSISLILARISQITFLSIIVFFLFPQQKNKVSLLVFLLILTSIILSGLVQNLYIYFSGKRFLNLKLIFDRNFIKKYLKNNWKYGVAYYFSSFHTLLVLILISIFFPTAKGYNYSGIWALSLSLLEILLIIPSALGNSFLHKISHLEKEKKLIGFGNFTKLIFRIGLVIFLNYNLFPKELILLIGSPKYLGNSTHIGSNIILPFLGFVLFESYIKQSFNYIFISNEKQNLLLPVNLIGVLIGFSFGLRAIPKFGLRGGIATQILLETLYVTGAVYLAVKNKILPKIKVKEIILNSGAILILFGIFKVLLNYEINLFWLIKLIVLGGIFNLLILGISYKHLKATIKGFDV